MRDVSQNWKSSRIGTLGAAVYDSVIEKQALAVPLSRAIFGTDLRKVYAAMNVVAEAPNGTAILDVPCGGGVTMRRLRRDQHLRYVAADISPVMLDRARKVVAECGVTAEFVDADIEHLPFADREFDLIVCFNGLHCLPDPGAAIGEMARCLRPGGRLISSFVSRGAVRRADAYASALRAAGVFGPSGTKADARNWLSSAGLVVEKFESSGAFVLFETRVHS